MEPPPVQYVKSNDGVNIAFCVNGTGPPLLVFSAWPYAHLQQELPLLTWMEATTRLVTVLRFDPRGLGLSDREVEDFSVDGFVSDVEAVVERARFDRFPIMASHMSVPIAIAYAARHPERVTRLVLWHGFAAGATDWNERWAALTAFAANDWEAATESLSYALAAWAPSEGVDALRLDMRKWALLLRASITPSTYLRFMNAARAWDTRDLLPKLTMPTFVGHNREYRYLSVDVAKRLASSMPGARLMLFDGSIAGFGPEAGAAITRFLAEAFEPVPADEATASEAAPQREETALSSMAVILFTDIVDSTPLTERMGDVAFRDASRALDAGLRAAIRDAGGTAIDGKLLGDGVMAVFTSAAQAIAAARRCIELSAESELGLHVGLHAGDVIREAGNVYGGAVNVASRICALSAPGEMLVSTTVRDLARTSAGVTFDDRGEQEMKGVGEPVRLYAVRWRE